MSQDIFLKLTGITGESQDASHKDEIEVLDWEWEITQGGFKSEVQQLSY